MNHFKRRVTAVVTGVLAAGLLLSACGGDGATDSSEVDRIDEAANSVLRLQADLEKVTNRLIINCMVTADFEVHPQELTTDPGIWIEVEGYRPLLGSEPPGMGEIPTVDVAKRQGFDWVDSGVYPDLGPDPYSDMSEEYQDEYDLARYGKEYLDYLRHGESPEDEPEVGGCTGEANKALETATGFPDGDPEWPPGVIDGEARIDRYLNEAVRDAQDAWAECVQDRGHPYFEFSEFRLNLRGFVATFYEESGYQGSAQGPEHEPPPGAPWPGEEARAKEIAFAVDAAECADESGLRDTMETEWNKTMVAIALENKDAIFAFHDSLEAALEAAAALIAE